MNIFVLDSDPAIAASMLCDRHVNKMILETAQMLTAVAARYNHPTLYKVSHAKHPCTLWAGDCYANWNWLIEHGIAMGQEKFRRTGVGHASIEVIKWYRDNHYGPPKDDQLMTPFAQAMPDKYKDINPVLAYRRYYIKDKQFFKDGKRPKWTNTEPPGWWKYA